MALDPQDSLKNRGPHWFPAPSPIPDELREELRREVMDAIDLGPNVSGDAVDTILSHLEQVGWWHPASAGGAYPSSPSSDVYAAVHSHQPVFRFRTKENPQ